MPSDVVEIMARGMVLSEGGNPDYYAERGGLKTYSDFANASIAALRKAGYVIAPVVPSEAMVEAGDRLPEWCSHCGNPDYEVAYTAMIAAMENDDG